MLRKGRGEERRGDVQSEEVNKATSVYEMKNDLVLLLLLLLLLYLSVYYAGDHQDADEEEEKGVQIRSRGSDGGRNCNSFRHSTFTSLGTLVLLP